MDGEIVPSTYTEPFRPTTFIGEIWEAQAAAHYFCTEEEAQVAIGIAYYVQQRWNQWDHAGWVQREPTHWQDAVRVLAAAGSSVLFLLFL